MQRRGRVGFPEFTGERVYMQAFTLKGGLPLSLRRWQDTVDAMLDGVCAPDRIFIMIDQGYVSTGSAHRRPGVHVDGAWIPEAGIHGNHQHGMGRWGEVGADSTLPCESITAGRHGYHGHSHSEVSEGLILASDRMGCKAYLGEYRGCPGEDGDCSHMDVSRMDEVFLEPGVCFAGDARYLLHESVPAISDGCRTLVRLNVEGWAPDFQSA